MISDTPGRGGGSKKAIFADVLYGWPLTKGARGDRGIIHEFVQA